MTKRLSDKELRELKLKRNLSLLWQFALVVAVIGIMIAAMAG